jgi:hypothetical protein
MSTAIKFGVVAVVLGLLSLAGLAVTVGGIGPCGSVGGIMALPWDLVELE